MNLYAYVGGDPINSTDIKGHAPDKTVDPSVDRINETVDKIKKFKRYLNGLEGCGKFLCSESPTFQDCSQCCTAINTALPILVRSGFLGNCLFTCHERDGEPNLRDSINEVLSQ